MTLPLRLSSRAGGRDGGSDFWLRGRRAAAAVWPTSGSGRRGGTEVEASAVPRSSAFPPGREGMGEYFTEVRTAAGRSGAERARAGRPGRARSGRWGMLASPAGRLFLPDGRADGSPVSGAYLAGPRLPLAPTPLMLLPRKPGRRVRAGIQGAWGVGGGWRTGCHVLLPGALIRGAPGRGLRVGLGRGLPVEVGFRALYPRGRAEAPVEPRLGATCPQIPVSTLPQCPALCPTVPRSRPSPASGDQNLF